MAQRVKNLPAMQETWVRSPGWEDPLVGCSDLGKWIPAWPVVELYQRGASFALDQAWEGRYRPVQLALSLHLCGDGGHGDAGQA